MKERTLLFRFWHHLLPVLPKYQVNSSNMIYKKSPGNSLWYYDHMLYQNLHSPIKKCYWLKACVHYMSCLDNSHLSWIIISIDGSSSFMPLFYVFMLISNKMFWFFFCDNETYSRILRKWTKSEEGVCTRWFWNEGCVNYQLLSLCAEIVYMAQHFPLGASVLNF